jgi:hypothetical protein
MDLDESEVIFAFVLSLPTWTITYPNIGHETYIKIFIINHKKIYLVRLNSPFMDELHP